MPRPHLDDELNELPPPPYCPSCAHHQFEITTIQPVNSERILEVLVCEECGTLCGVVGFLLSAP